MTQAPQFATRPASSPEDTIAALAQHFRAAAQRKAPDEYGQGKADAMAIAADQITAALAEYQEAIESPAQLDALPVGSAFQDGRGYINEKATDGWYTIGSLHRYSSTDLALPGRLLLIGKDQ